MMKYRRRDEPNGSFTNTSQPSTDEESEEEEILNDNKTMPPINKEEKYLLKRIFPFLPSKSSAPTTKLAFSIIIDIIGFFTQIIPVFGIAFWPSISTYLIYKVYGSGVHLCVSFLEETVPGFGIIPTATLCWANETYNVIPKINGYLPTRYIKIARTIYSVLKKVSIGIVLIVAYKLISYFSPYLPFFGGSHNHDGAYQTPPSR